MFNDVRSVAPKKAGGKVFKAKYTATEFFSHFPTAYVEHATWSKNKLLNDTIVEIVTSKQPASIADFGTGDGGLLSLFPHVNTRIGIDVSPEMLGMIQDPSIVKILGDIHNVAIPSASVDFVICRQVLHYCEPTVVLQEANRILRDNGHVLIVQTTDCDEVPIAWYAKWKAFKQIKQRKHLTLAEILQHAKDASFQVAMKRRCPVEIELSWSDLFKKCAATSRRQQNAISKFFRETPKSIAKRMHLTTHSRGISYQHVFSCVLLRKASQWPKRKLTIIINGATGVGKSTASSYLSHRLNCPCISTDHIRRILRSKLTPQQCPVIYRSSYEISSRPDKDAPQQVAINYVAQAEVIIGEIGRHYLTSRESCKILEGVHLNPTVLSILKHEDYVVFYLKMPSIQEHKRRLQQRNLLDPVMRAKHRAYLRSIRVIGTFLDRKWTAKTLNNKRVFLIDNWQEIAAILEAILVDSTVDSQNLRKALTFDNQMFKKL